MQSQARQLPATDPQRLHELTEAGLIRVDGRTVHVPDVDRLRAYE